MPVTRNKEHLQGLQALALAKFTDDLGQVMWVNPDQICMAGSNDGSTLTIRLAVDAPGQGNNTSPVVIELSGESAQQMKALLDARVDIECSEGVVFPTFEEEV